MARIRSIKPEFFRHEGLQDLASKHGAHVMLVFAGLWGHCDKAGRFEWRPRSLKLDILPFIEFDMEAVLCLLRDAGMVEQYEVENERYGFIPTFTEHQTIGGKEKELPERFPAPPEKKSVKRRGRNGDVTGASPSRPGEALVNGRGKQEGEGKRNKEGKGDSGSPDGDPPEPSSGDGLGTDDAAVVANYWNNIAEEHGLAAVVRMTDERRKKIQARLSEAGGLRKMVDVIDAIASQPFLLGQNDRQWKVDFDWLLKPSNFVKVEERKYANGHA